ncbi:MAG: glycosyltransferase family 2 protein [Chthonomonadaceae bacterium]|nr:glycosyltransferase family 2 protein [Chthonomonadaceae bacterium]
MSSSPLPTLTELNDPAFVAPSQAETARATLSVLMPVYNERQTLPGLLERIASVSLSTQLILVDDGSTDGTREWLQSEVEGKREGVQVFYHPENRGKGAAIRTAIPFATGTFCIVQDGDLEYDPQDYRQIVEAFGQEGVSVVYGSRFLAGLPSMRPANRLVNKLLAGMVRVLYRSPMTDEATCYKAFRTEVLQGIPLQCRRFEFCPEVTAKVLRRGYRIVEVSIQYKARSMAEGKKIRWTDGVSAIWNLIRWRFGKF